MSESSSDTRSRCSNVMSRARSILASAISSPSLLARRPVSGDLGMSSDIAGFYSMPVGHSIRFR